MRIPRSLLAAIGLAALAWAFSAPVMATPPKGWLLAFDEEFDGKHLDASKWGTTMSFIGTQGPRFHNENYLSYTLDENVVFSDGHLRLRVDRRTIAGTEPVGAFDYTQGLISTDGKFSFTYGYVEIRAKYPAGKGLWPCFWLMPQNQQWPPEFDIAEYYAGRQTMHFGMAHGTIQETVWDHAYDSSPNLEGEWHTYALQWTVGHAAWFVDGILQKSVEAEYVPVGPMFILLSNSVSSRFGPSGVPDEKTVFPSDLEVEYVRVYQAPRTIPAASATPPNIAKVEASPAAAGPAGPAGPEGGVANEAAAVPGK
jgi:beta-glucanase (GH16 family)